MAAAIVTTATTVEAQIMEVALAIQDLEVAAAESNSLFEPKLTVSPDAEGQTITVSITLDVENTNTAGTLGMVPQEYL